MIDMKTENEIKEFMLEHINMAYDKGYHDALTDILIKLKQLWDYKDDQQTLLGEIIKNIHIDIDIIMGKEDNE